MLLHPHRVYTSPFEVTAGELAGLGVRALLLDIDGTIARTCEPEPAPAVVQWARGLTAQGISLFILSNNKHPLRVQRFGEMLGCGYMYRAGKPRRRGFEQALRVLGCSPGQAALLGDQIFTDVLGARRCGLKALRVESTDTQLWYYGLRRFFETPFLGPRE